MQRLTAPLIATAFAVVLCACSALAATLADLEAQYSQDREALSWKYVEKKNQIHLCYTNALLALEVSFKSKGELDGVLAVRKELELLTADAAGGIPDSSTIPEIAELRSKNRKTAAEAAIEEKKAIVATAQQHVERLKALERELTIADKIEEAVEVQARRKTVMDDPDVVAAVSAGIEVGETKPPPAGTVPKSEPKPGLPDPKDGSIALHNGVDLSGWKSTGGQWVAEERCIRGTAERRDAARTFTDQQAGQDYEFSVRLKVVGGDDAGVVFHDRDRSSYTFGLGSGVIGSGQKGWGMSKDYMTGVWHEVRLIVHGRQAKVAVNGKTVWRGSDLAVDSGRVGLWIKPGSSAVFFNPRHKTLRPVPTLSPRPTAKGFSPSGLGGAKGSIKTFD
ncbi:MAG: DUF1080 domain-containing protein [bacterium]